MMVYTNILRRQTTNRSTEHKPMSMSSQIWAINIYDKLSLIKFSNLRYIAQNNIVCVSPDSGQRCKQILQRISLSNLRIEQFSILVLVTVLAL